MYAPMLCIFSLALLLFIMRLPWLIAPASKHDRTLSFILFIVVMLCLIITY
jgi:hypothetical protein